jgi:hypothetical protein
MPFTTLNLGISLQIPTNGTRNWGTTVRATTWTKISSHDHTGSGNGAPIPAGGIADRSITSIKLALNIGFVQGATLTPLLGTQTVDFATGTIQKVDLGSASGDVTLTLSNPVTSAYYRIEFLQGATPRDVFWPASVKWRNNQKLALNQVAGSLDVVELYYDGSEYHAKWYNSGALTPQTNTPAGTTQTINWDRGVAQKLALGSASGDVTLTLSNPQPNTSYKLIITQGATPRDLIWPAAVKWPQAQKLILSQSVGNIDVVNLFYDGTNYYADWDETYS